MPLKKITGTDVTLFAGPIEVAMFGDVAEEVTRHLSDDLREVDGVKSWLHRDHLSSVRFITGPSGLAARLTSYTAFGEPSTAVTDPTVSDESKGFIGERFDPETGLQYLNARYYDPVLGRFIQPDWWEVTEPGVGTNRYAYSGNNPTNQRDPGGNGFWDWLTGGDSGNASNPDTEADKGSDEDATRLIMNSISPADAAVSIGVGTYNKTQDLANMISSGVPTGGSTGSSQGSAHDELATQALVVGTVYAGGKLGIFSRIGKAFSAVLGKRTRTLDAPNGAAAGSVENVGSGSLGQVATETGQITFQSSHAARHLSGTNLSPAEVEAAIRAEVGQIVTSSSAKTGEFWGNVTIGNTRIEYRAFTLENGTVNIGTYYPK